MTWKDCRKKGGGEISKNIHETRWRFWSSHAFFFTHRRTPVVRVINNITSIKKLLTSGNHVGNDVFKIYSYIFMIIFTKNNERIFFASWARQHDTVETCQLSPRELLLVFWSMFGWLSQCQKFPTYKEFSVVDTVQEIKCDIALGLLLVGKRTLLF